MFASVDHTYIGEVVICFALCLPLFSFVGTAFCDTLCLLGEILRNLTNQSFIVKIFPVNLLQLNKSLSASTYGSCMSSCESVYRIMSLSNEARMSLLQYFKPFRVKRAQHRLMHELM